MFTKASTFAAKAHAGQTRKATGMPYIIHPVSVVTILMDHGVMDEVTLTAAVLHDVVEDTEATIEVIERRFGDKVAEIVAALTKPEDGSRDERKAAALVLVAGGPAEAKAIKMADRLDNLRGMIDLPWSQKLRAKYATEAVAIATIGMGTLPSLSAVLMREAAIHLDDVVITAVQGQHPREK